MSKQKIIHVVSSLNVGGAERFVIDLSQRLKETNHPVEILSFGSENDTLCQVAKDIGIKVTSISNSSSVFGQLKLLKVLFNCDVIHLHTPRLIKTLSLVLKVIGKKNLVYTRHGAADLSSADWKKLHAKFKQYVSYMTFVSQEAMEVYTQVYAWQDIQKVVVDNGVNIPELTSKKPNSLLKVGSVGRFVTLKNQISLLKALSLIPNESQQKIEIHLFGNGECEQQLRAFVEDKNLNQSVIFHGMVNDRSQIYNTFDMLCVTSETEGLSLAIMEAMAFALPVLATDVGGNSKLVKDEINGWLFNYNDSEAIAERMLWALENKKILGEFGLHGREYIQNTFSIDVAKNKYVEIYTQK